MQKAHVFESYSRLKVVLGDEQTLQLINFLEARDEDKQESFEETVATKADIAELKQATKADIAELKQATHADIAELIQSTKAVIAELKQATKADIAEMKLSIAELKLSTKADIAESKSELLKWMFIFWVGQAATTVAIILAVFKH